MKRAIIAVAALSILYGAPAAADYLFIKIDLAKVNFGGGGGTQQAPGQVPPGGDMAPGGFGDPMGGFVQPAPAKKNNAFPNNPDAFKQGGTGMGGRAGGANPGGMMGGAGMMGSS